MTCFTKHLMKQGKRHLMTRLMTYDEVAETFGITRNSARQLVGRKRWMKRKGNDGKARVEVPLEALPPAREAASEAASDTASEASHQAPHEVPVMLLLKHLVERQDAELAELRPKAAERDALAVQVEALRAALDVANADRDRWHATAERLALPPPAPRRRWWWRRAG